MLNKNLKLSKEIFKRGAAKKSTRDGFGEGLVSAGEVDERVVALTADLRESTRVKAFSERFPERYFEVGVAEQSLITVSSGLANYGKIPFCTSYAVFSPGRTFEQIKVTVALNNVPVKVVGEHVGFGAAPYGATHESFEDASLMRIIPNMVVVAPCDAIEAKKATEAIAKNGKPSYIRLTRGDTNIITTEETPFEIGKAEVFWESKNPQVTIIASGPLLYEALVAAKNLEKVGIETLVINNHTIKPMDKQTIIHSARISGAVVTVEEHQKAGGMGSAVAEILAENFPVPIEFIGMPDSFGESGTEKELLEKYSMQSEDIIGAVKRVIKRKNSNN